MKILLSVFYLAFLSLSCTPEKREEEKIRQNAERSDQENIRESQEHSQMGTNESSVTH